MNSNDVNNAFSREAQHCRDWLDRRLVRVGCVPAKVLADRLVQRVVELGRLPYAREALQGRLAQGTVVDIGGADLETGTGRILLSQRQWWRCLLQHLIHWGYCSIAIMVVRWEKVADGPMTLVSGIGEEALFQGGSDLEFVRYCSNGPIVPLREGAQLFVQSQVPGQSSLDPRIRYVRRPLIEMIRRAPLGLSGRLRVLAGHALALLGFIVAAIRRPELALLGRDFAYVVSVRAIDDTGALGSIIVTCTSISEQPLWSRCLQRAKVHMVWYAQNWKPVVFKADGVASDIPFLRWLRVDMHWVWTKAFARYLSGVGASGDVRVVGPIIWRLPLAGSRTPTQAVYLGVFDVSPYDDQVALSYCESPNFNGPANLTLFVQDLLAVRRHLEGKFGIKVVLRFKTKRGYRSAYDRKYFDFIESLADGGEIDIVHYATNLFQMISECDAIIAYPYTSPPYIGAELGVPSTFFDPTQTIQQESFADQEREVAFAGSAHELEDWLCTVLEMARKSREGSQA